jgi:transcriptional regulator with XRE-family HTH domain
MTQKELGEAIGKSDRTVSEWESGRGQPGRDSIMALAHVFKISADEFLRLLPANGLPHNPGIDRILDEEDERKRGHGPERTRARHILEDLIDHPDLWERWMSYGEFLLTQKP